MTNGATRTQILTFRLNSQDVIKLKDKAFEQGVPLSALVSHILTRYLEVDTPASKAGLVYSSKKLLSRLAAEIPEEKMSAIAKEVASPELDALTCMLQNKLDCVSKLNSLCKLAEYSGFAYKEMFENGTRIISLNHDMGSNYTSLMKKTLDHCFADVKDSRVQIETPTDGIIVIRLKEV